MTEDDDEFDGVFQLAERGRPVILKPPPPGIPHDAGYLLVEHLLDWSMTLTDLADRLKVSRQHVYYLAHGLSTFTIEMALAIEAEIELPAEDLLTAQMDHRLAMARAGLPRPVAKRRKKA